MSIIDKVESHFQEVLSSGLQGPIEVPEWDTKLWWKPTTTLAEESVIMELTSQGKSTEALVMSLIIRARTEDNKPAFEKHDKVKLMRVADPRVVLRVITEMNTVVSEYEDTVKN